MLILIYFSYIHFIYLGTSKMKISIILMLVVTICLLCSVSAYANNLTSQNQACLTTYGTCRKYQDASGAAISTCSKSTAGLASQLKSLTTNAALVNQVQSKISSLTSRIYEPIVSSKVATATAKALTCAQFIDLTSQLIQAMAENPASTLVAGIAAQLVNSSASCSASDVAALQNLDKSINETETKITDELGNVQSDLTGDHFYNQILIHEI